MRYKNRLEFILETTKQWCKDSWYRDNSLDRNWLYATPLIPFISLALSFSKKYRDISTGEYLFNESFASDSKIYNCSKAK